MQDSLFYFVLMAYLRLRDYNQNIQSGLLDQLTSADSTVRISAELLAQEMIISYLKQKYDTTEEFRDTRVWSPATTYKANDLVYLDATAYSASATYALQALVLQAGKIYICIVAITVGEAFNASKWTLLGSQYDMFYVTVPKSEFNYETLYEKDDEVFYKDKTYTAILGSTPYDHETALQYRVYANLPFINIFPNDPTYGTRFWGTGVAYTVAAGTLPTVTAKWTEGDNRSQQMVDCMIDIALYKIHSRIAPRNIPQLRIDNFDNAITWLKACAKGFVSPDLPIIQPKQGSRIRYGGNIKNINSY